MSPEVTNRILESRPTIPGPHFVYHMPKWAVIALKGVFLLFGVAAFCLAFYWTGINPIFITGFIYFLSGTFLLIAVVSKGREIVYFICDYSGMYFPSYQSLNLRPTGKSEAWLFVPWTNIRHIKTATLGGGERGYLGLSFSVRATPEEQEIFFGNPESRKWLSRRNTDEEGFLIVGYSNAFQGRKKVVSILEQFRMGFCEQRT